MISWAGVALLAAVIGGLNRAIPYARRRARHCLTGPTGVGDLVERLTAQRRALPPAPFVERCYGDAHVHSTGGLTCRCGAERTSPWVLLDRRPPPTSLPGPGERSPR